jgi:hypothetical protein
MSYESTLYVVEKSSAIESGEPRFCWQIARYDISCFPPIAYFFREDNPEVKFTDCGLYLDGNGDKQVTEDMYGDKLREASLEAVINVLKYFKFQHNKFPRVIPLLTMIESFYEIRDKFKNMVVIHFGH